MQPVRQSADQCCGADAESKTMFALTRSVASKPHSARLSLLPSGCFPLVDHADFYLR